MSNTLAKITIKGITLLLPVEEIYSYKALRKRFIKEGIALIPVVKEAEWFALFAHLLESNPVPEQAMATTNSVSTLVEYLNAHIGERLVVSRLNAGMTAQNARPTKELSQRYDKDTHTLWVNRKHVRNYLETNHFDYNRTRDDLITRGVLLDAKVLKTLGAGTEFSGGQTVCWKICANHPELARLISEHP